MQAGPSNMAYTEVSAVSGCLFVGLGLGVMVLNEPMAWIVRGLAYGGAAVGRVTSILRDNAASRQSWTFFGLRGGAGRLADPGQPALRLRRRAGRCDAAFQIANESSMVRASAPSGLALPSMSDTTPPTFPMAA